MSLAATCKLIALEKPAGQFHNTIKPASLDANASHGDYTCVVVTQTTEKLMEKQNQSHNKSTHWIYDMS